MTIIAAADGSALGNPGPAGWAWYVDDDRWSAGGWPHATNNQGELMAVLDLFRATEQSDDDLLVLCDSQYVINSVTKWMPGWKAKGWRKGDGKPVMNLELLREIDAVLVGRRYRFEWVKGHADHPLNEAADFRARTAAEAFQRRTTVPEGPGWPSDAGSARPPVQVTPVPPVAMVRRPEMVRQPDLFSGLDLADHAITLNLDAAQFARLTARAAAAGVSLEQALLDLV